MGRHVARMREKRNTYWILVQIVERTFLRPESAQIRRGR
jgi:hypothetical protein